MNVGGVHAVLSSRSPRKGSTCLNYDMDARPTRELLVKRTR